MAVILKTTGKVNQRKGATTSHEIIQTIPKGKKVEWDGYSFCGDSVEWKLVTYNGKLGFVSSKYLKEV